jgi:hypothetical protein
MSDSLAGGGPMAAEAQVTVAVHGFLDAHCGARHVGGKSKGDHAEGPVIRLADGGTGAVIT